LAYTVHCASKKYTTQPPTITLTVVVRFQKCLLGLQVSLSE